MERFQIPPPPKFDFTRPEEWSKWIKRFERFRIASGLELQAEENQVNTLIYTMGDEAEDIITSLQLTEEEASQYNTVKNKLDAHFVVRRNVIFERAKFNQRQQEQGETVDSFITSLHCLSEHCGYGLLHDEMVRDRLVVGLRDKKLSEQLQLDSALTLEKAVTRARQSEQVKNQQDLLKSNFKSAATDVDSIQMKFQPATGRGRQQKKTNDRSGYHTQLGSQRRCMWCGRTPAHSKHQCPARDVACNVCQKKGHYGKVCRSGAVNEVSTTGSDEEEVAFLGTVSSDGEPWLITLKVNEDTAVFKIDTGADVTVLSEEIFHKGQFPQLESTKKVLQGPGRTPITVRGKFSVSIGTENKSTTQEVYVVPDLKCNLLGRPAIQALGLVARVDAVALDSRERVKEQFPKLFKGLGKMEGDYKIELRADAKPFSISTPRRVPLPLMSQVKKELSRMEEIGVISRVEQPTDWCAGMVPVPKPGKNEVRICVDLTKLNESVKRERHMLPSVEHTLGQLEGAKVFSKIDANSGFWQIPLAKESALLTTFLTPFGRFCFNRLCFGISSAPEHYQKRMSRLLEGLDGVLCQMDDVLVFGDTQAQHDTRLSTVLERLQEAGVTLRSDKCEFSKRHVKFLGQIIDAAGVRADPDKVRAVTDMEEPEDVSGVRRFLGMVNHLGKYLPNLAEKTQPLRDLLKKQNTFQWGHQQQRAFNIIKKELSSPPGLALYNSKAETVVSADASSFGLGAVLLQRQEEGYLKPVAYSSRALTETEKRYAQIEKEALAITWACERFSDYLVGIRFHVETDHKPLVPLLGSKSLDELPPRIQRLRMRLMAFCYSISHVAGKKLATADVLSRAPLRESGRPTQEEEIKLYVSMVMSTLPATEKRLEEIRKCQDGDEILSQVKRYCSVGWPDRSEIDRAYLPYAQVEEELTVEEGLLLKGCRLVIPKSLHTDIIQKLHAGHQGIVKCRERAKQSVWWPGLSTQLQKVVEGCDTCTKKRDNPREPLLTSDFPDRPWAKVGADLFQWDDNQYLLVVDYFSRFIEVAKLTSTTSLAVVEHCKSIFARHGIPSELLSDNGPQFSSERFSEFAAQWGFTHTTSSPRYAQSNGEAERAVRTVKGLLQKEEDPYLALLAYRATPLANGHSPAQLSMGRQLRTTLPVTLSSLNPGWTDIAKLKEEEQRMRQRSRVNFNKRHRAQQLSTLTPGKHVWIKDTKEKGTVISQADTPRSYVIDSPRGTLRRNRHHLVSTPVPPAEQTISPEPDLPADQPVSPALAEQTPVRPESPAQAEPGPAEPGPAQPGSPVTRARYPARERQPPGYLKDFVPK